MVYNEWFRASVTLSCLLVVMVAGLCRPRFRGTGWVAGALLMSFLGDYVLGHWGGSFEGFVCGVGLFLVAHLGYMGFCLVHGRMAWRMATALCLIFGAYYIVLLRPAIGDAVTSLAVLAYIIVSCLSLSAAVGMAREKSLPASLRVLYVMGISSLLFSDLLIAEKRFLHHGTLYPLMMPTYFASHLLITAGMVWGRCKQI